MTPLRTAELQLAAITEVLHSLEEDVQQTIQQVVIELLEVMNRHDKGISAAAISLVGAQLTLLAEQQNWVGDQSEHQH